MKLNKSNHWNQNLQTQKIFDKNFNQNQARDDEIAKLNSTCTRRKRCPRLDMKLNKSNLLESKFYTLKNL
jgi:predicted metal-binding transcription factor (methanogenesis marker protein 9)